MSEKRVFKFSYHLVESDRRRTKLHKQRDGDAFTELMAILSPLGYTYQDLILNIPPPALPDNRVRLDLSFLQPTDLVVLASRPPISDDKRKVIKKRMHPSYTNLEGKLFGALGPCFKISDRQNIQLSDVLFRKLDSEFKNRAHITFRQTLGSLCKYYHDPDTGEEQKPGKLKRTAAYLVIPRKKRASDPQFLNCFGMGGTETLIWAYLLRKRYWQEFGIDPDKPRYIMVELFPKSVAERPPSLAFAESWRVEKRHDVKL